MRSSMSVIVGVFIAALIAFPIPSSGQSSAPGLPPLAADPTTALFAQVAIGGGYTTVFTFVNTGVDNVVGKLIMTKSNGDPLTGNFLITLNSPTMNAGLIETGFAAEGSAAPIAVRSGGVQILTATAVDPTGPVQVGWARVESTGGSLAGVATFQYSPGGSLQTIVGVLSSDGTSVATIPVNNDDSVGRQTGFAVANPSATDVLKIRIAVVRTDGSQAGSIDLPDLKPGNQTARFLHEVDRNTFLNLKGSAVLIEASGKPFAVTGLVQAQSATGVLFTAIPVVPAKSIGIN